MADPPPPPPSGERAADWNCIACGAPQAVAPGAPYHRCSACGSPFKLSWRSGRLETEAIRRLPIDAIDAQLAPELLRQRVDRDRLQLRELNERIRKLEMSKGSERLALIAVFVIVCAAIYALFHLTVFNSSALLHPGPLEIGVATTAGFAAIVLLLMRLRRGVIVRKVMSMDSQRVEIQRDLEGCEAALALRGFEQEKASAGKRGSGEEKETDIIGKFAYRRRERRGRLSLRNGPREE